MLASYGDQYHFLANAPVEILFDNGRRAWYHPARCGCTACKKCQHCGSRWHEQDQCVTCRRFLCMRCCTPVPPNAPVGMGTICLCFNCLGAGQQQADIQRAHELRSAIYDARLGGPTEDPGLAPDRRYRDPDQPWRPRARSPPASWSERHEQPRGTRQRSPDEQQDVPRHVHGRWLSGPAPQTQP